MAVDYLYDKWNSFWNWLWGKSSDQSQAIADNSPKGGERASGQAKIGNAPAYADGGRVRGPGTSRSDSIWARLSDGENVINSRATKFFGQGVMDGLNALDPTAVFRAAPIPVPVSSGQGAGLHPVTLDLRDGPVSGLYGTPDAVDQVRRYIQNRRNTQYASPSRSS